ncbi:MAG TPA: bacillithiol biosynthesis cysteine-adding enzyme BshC [Candidatus Hydrogenedentes bacterium]|nr:bacillithiol biosynthesis cysteine-adding enzyme BshC [Candidatus Hydrogenedentota bacterium]HPG69827.1 bacillithiol biosynthesis cysteine-adding enzyme BshC [Candidatus Hydrogenedentota bacterium]
MLDVFEDYCAGALALGPLFAGGPRGALEVRPRAASWPEGLAEALVRYNASLGKSVTLRGDEAVVVTGQQPGVLTGPLYTIYKAITAIRLAHAIEKRHGVPCVPVFWVAGDDHDFAEARATWILTRDYRPWPFVYEPEAAVEGRPMRRVPLAASLHGLVDEAARQARGSELSREVRTFLHDSLSDSATIEAWFARVMARLFGNTPLVLFAPHIPEARYAARAVIQREIVDPLVTTRRVNAGGAALTQLGYAPQIVKGDDECGFFLEMGERRRKVLYDGRRYVIPEESMTCSVDEMLAFLDSAPERFSPNVALRCVVQQALFPAVAYVAGPGEVAYWAQLKPLFGDFGFDMPFVYPRARGVLTPTKIAKLLDKFSLQTRDLDEGREAVVRHALRAIVRNPAREALERRRPEVEGAVEALARDLADTSAPAAEMADRLIQRVRDGLDRIEQSTLEADAVQADAVTEQVRRVCDALAPFGKPQERVYTVFSFLFEHGFSLIGRLAEELDVESFQGNEVVL